MAKRGERGSQDYSTGEGGHLRPLFTLGKSLDKDDDALHEWCTDARDTVLDNSRERIPDIYNNLDLYKGYSAIEAKGRDARSRLNTIYSSNRFTRVKNKEARQVVVPLLYSLTENLVSRITRYQPTVTIFPANTDEPSDRENARLVKDLIDYLQYVNDFDRLTREWSRIKYVQGEAYIFVEWDPDKGDAHPDAITTSESIQQNVKLGDVDYRVVHAYNMFLQPVRSGDFEDVQWAIERQWRDIDELKVDYPDKKQFIKPGENKDEVYNDSELYIEGKLNNEVPVYTLWHKGNKYLPDGRKIVFTDHGVLENGKNPYNHKSFPFVRITDIDIDDDVYAKSIFSMNKELGILYNNMYSMSYDNIIRTSRPKWLVDRSSQVKKESLANQISMVEYDNGIKPELATFPTTPPEVFQLMQDMRENLQNNMKVFSVSRGEPPPGVKAAVAMQFLDEQENELFNSDVNKHHNAIKRIWFLTLSVVQQFYDKSDKRLIKIFGKDGNYKVKRFDPSVFATPFDIRIENQSNLPNSKAARVQTILEIDERRPMPDDQFFDNLGLGTPEAYISDVTKAKTTADLENQDIMQGTEIQEPQMYEDHLSHHSRHMIAMQSAGFKEAAPEVKQALIDHVMVHEMFMVEKAFFNGDMNMIKNPAMAQALAALPNFPAVFEVGAPPPPPPPPLPEEGASAPLPPSMDMMVEGPPPLEAGLDVPPGLPIDVPPLSEG